MPIITLLTDFGLQDTFVAQMHGVILGICPDVHIVDCCHEVPPQDVADGAWQLAQAWRAFPQGSIHVAVVDPGVGSERRAIVAKLDGHCFVAPDNGLLSLLGERQQFEAVHQIVNTRFTRPQPSRTFHGRDLFAPIAAHLASGIGFSDIGPAIDDWQRLPHADCQKTTAGLRGSIVHVDHFGNCISCIHADRLPKTYRVGVKGRNIPVVDCYSDAPIGMPIALISGSGHLEIAINQGNAAEELGLSTGLRIDIVRN